MTFDWLSRFRRPGPTRDPRGQPHPQRPPVLLARSHGKRPAPTPQARPQLRRGPHRDLRPTMPVPIARTAVPSRKGPVARPPARPPPPQRTNPLQRGPSKPLQCLHIHFHPSQKRVSAQPPLRIPSKSPSKQSSSQPAPPYPPPRGVPKRPSRHVHWAPAQAPLPNKPYPYPSQATSRSHSASQPRSVSYPSPPQVPRYQPPPHPPKQRPLMLPYRSG